METFGRILKELRTESKISQSKLGAEVGVSQDMISLYELGESQPNLSTLVKIAKYFNVTTDYLLGLEEY